VFFYNFLCRRFFNFSISVLAFCELIPQEYCTFNLFIFYNMKSLQSLFIILFLLNTSGVCAQEKYKYQEETTYSSYDTSKTNKILNDLGNVIYEESLGWSKLWRFYKDTLLSEEVKVSLTDSVDTATQYRFVHFYTDTTKRFYKYSFDKMGRVANRIDTIMEFTAKHPFSCVRYVDEQFDYTREWIRYTDAVRLNYDAAGRKISEHSKDNLKTWAYDSIGRLLEENDINHRVFEYLPDRKIIKKIYSVVDTFVLDQIISRDLDKNGRIVLQLTTESNETQNDYSEEQITYEYGEEKMDERIESVRENKNLLGKRLTIIHHTNNKPDWADAAIRDAPKPASVTNKFNR